MTTAGGALSGRDHDQPGTVAVIGAGAMGAGIAQVAAVAGHPVLLVDAVDGAAERGRERIGASLRRQADRGRMTTDAAEAATARISVAASADDLPPCALVIEAILEELGAKQELFAALAAGQPADTLLASNTSSLDLTAIATDLPGPQRVLGLHFFNPPPAMKLVEVIRGAGTSEETLARGEQLMAAWGKATVRCTSTPGFIVNRIARPFYGESQRMLEAGVADAATLDAALRGAGFSMGPLELTDLIGQDVNLAVGTSVWEQTGQDPRYAPTAYQQDLVAAGHLGRKSGRGVYDHADGAATPEPDQALVERLVGGPIETDPVARTLAMLVNEAADLVHRGEANPADVDTAMRLGTNYPRGPLEWGAEIGYAVVAGQIAELDRAFPGGRYRPSPGLDSLSPWSGGTA